MKLALVTKGKESSSWPTIRASEYKDCGPLGSKSQKHMSDRSYLCAKVKESWATPQASDHIEGARTAKESNQKCLGRDLNQMENWATPNTMDHMETRSAEGVRKIASGARKGRKRPNNLREQVDKKTCDIYKEENWPTPRAGNPGSRKPGTGGKILAEEAKKNWGTPQARDWKGAQGRAYKGGAKDLLAQTEGVPPHVGPPAQEKSNTSGKNHGSPKLNPNWVEQLMGLPVGWTQLPTEWIDSDCLVTELSPKQQN
jgi:hypothetical protein